MAQLEPKKISALSDEQKAALLEALGVQTVLPVLTEYPTTDATKAGTKFLYKGNEWHYMTQAEIDSCEWTGLVEVGFPAPVNKTFNIHILFPQIKTIFLTTSSANLVEAARSGSTSNIDALGYGNPTKVIQIKNTGVSVINGFKNFGLLTNLEDIGTSRCIVLSCGLTAPLLNELFTQLPITTKTATLDVTGNPGSATCDPAIATAKGYTVLS